MRKLKPPDKEKSPAALSIAVGANSFYHNLAYHARAGQSSENTRKVQTAGGISVFLQKNTRQGQRRPKNCRTTRPYQKRSRLPVEVA